MTLRHRRTIAANLSVLHQILNYGKYRIHLAESLLICYCTTCARKEAGLGIIGGKFSEECSDNNDSP